jgi:hypothetical protein
LRKNKTLTVTRLTEPFRLEMKNPVDILIALLVSEKIVNQRRKSGVVGVALKVLALISLTAVITLRL